MIQTTPCLPLSGRPIDERSRPARPPSYAPRAVPWSSPPVCHQTEPNSGLGRVPFFLSRLDERPPLRGIGFCLELQVLGDALEIGELLHSTENGCWPGSVDESKHTRRFVPFLIVS